MPDKKEHPVNLNYHERLEYIRLLEQQLTEARKDALISITEMIGEMAWGIELPSPMRVVMQELMGKPEEVHAVHPDNYKPVFEAIYQKLKLHPDYSALGSERNNTYKAIERAEKAEQENKRLRKSDVSQGMGDMEVLRVDGDPTGRLMPDSITIKSDGATVTYVQEQALKKEVE